MIAAASLGNVGCEISEWLTVCDLSFNRGATIDKVDTLRDKKRYKTVAVCIIGGYCFT